MKEGGGKGDEREEGGGVVVELTQVTVHVYTNALAHVHAH